MGSEGINVLHVQWNLTSHLINKLHPGQTGTCLLYAGGVLLCILVPYLLGSLNFGILISRRRYRDDVRRHGSGNAGATNMLRVYGRKAAILTLVGDMLKAALAVAFGYLMLSGTMIVRAEASGQISRLRNESGAAIAGLFVTLGHMFPCFYRFRGGKGVATAAVVVLMINPIVFLCLLIVFCVIVAGTKYVSLASVMGVILYPIVLSAFSSGGRENSLACALSVVMACLVVYMHRDNLRRLANGEEPKFSFRKGGAPGAGAAPDGLGKEGRAAPPSR